jgi:hypothetical protein
MVGGGGGSGGDWGDDSAIGGGGTGGDWGEVFYRGLSQREFEEYKLTGTISSHYAFFGGKKANIAPNMGESMRREHYKSSKCVGMGLSIPQPPQMTRSLQGTYHVERSRNPDNSPRDCVMSPYLSITTNPQIAFDSATWPNSTVYGGPSSGRIMRIERMQTPTYPRTNAGSAAYEQEHAAEWHIGRQGGDIVKVGGVGYVPQSGDDTYWSAIPVYGWR